MRATMDTLDVIEPVQAKRVGGDAAQSLLKSPARKHNPATPRRQKEEKWSSSLDPQDLRCLLTILETSLIPQLVRSYSPAAAMPLLRAGRDDA